MDWLKKRLNARISLLLTGIAVVVFTVITLINSLEQHESFSEQLEQSLTRTARLMRQAIEKPMVTGDDAGTKAQFAFLAKEYRDVGLYMTNYKGNITYSTDLAVVRKDFAEAVQSPELVRLVGNSLKNMGAHTIRFQEGGSDFYARTVSIANEPSCHHCHASSEPILGSMIVVQDVSASVAHLNRNTLTGVLMSLGGMIVLIGTVLFFVRRSVLNRLLHIAQASEEVVAGNYNADFKVSGEDELWQLSSNLGEMVAELKNKLGFSGGILKGMTTPFVVTDTNFNITFLNQPLLDLFQIEGTSADFTGERIDTFLFGEQRDDMITMRCIREEKPQLGFASVMETRAGEQRHVTIDTVPLFDLDGVLLGGFTLYTDLTEIRQNEARILDQNNTMARVADQAVSIASALATAAEELSSQVDEASSGSSVQRERIQEMSTAMEQMSASVIEIAQNAAQASKDADTARSQAMDGSTEVTKAVQSIHEVQEHALELKANMSQLGEHAEAIRQVMQVINDIADQTNLLALNAAIEAARAGDAGRGFAVVADEVRKLAERTQAATSEVGGAINTILDEIEKNIKGTETASKAVDVSTELAGRSGGILQEIVSLVEHSADDVRSIATASEEQSATTEQINRSTDEINAIAEETARIMAGSAEAVTELSRLATELDQLIQEIKG